MIEASKQTSMLGSDPAARIPTAIVTSGGYSHRSHELVAEIALSAVEQLRED